MLHRPPILGPRFALFLLLVVVALALAGCGGKY
jgi:hypothetical protein